LPKASFHITNCKKQSEPTQVFIFLHVRGIFHEMIFVFSLVLLEVTWIESLFYHPWAMEIPGK